MNKYLVIPVAFLFGFIVCKATEKRYNDQQDPMRSPIPERILISKPEDSNGNREAVWLYPSGQGMSHESTGLAPSSWRVVFTYPGQKVWWYEASSEKPVTDQ